MTTFFMDPINGNDASAGTSFATRIKSGSAAAFANIAAGDSVRWIKSGDKRDSGVAVTWPAAPTAREVTPIAVTSASNATPIVLLCATTPNAVAGDYVMLNGTNVAAINAMWKVASVSGNNVTLANSTAAGAATGGSLKVVTSSVLEANVPIKALCLPYADKETSALWTASTNVTATLNSSLGTPANNLQLSVATAFTTGKAAYITLPSTLDLSSYQGVSFYFKSTAAFTLNLCTDTLGATVAHAISVPANGLGSVKIFTWDNGAALNAAIASMSISFAVDPGVITVWIGQIVATKAAGAADYLSYNTLVSNGVATEALYPISGLYNNKIVFGNVEGAILPFDTITPYEGSLSASNLFLTSPLVIAASYSSTNSFSTAGTQAAPVTVSGGWDTTDMSTRPGETIIDARSCVTSYGEVKTTSSAAYITLQDLLQVAPANTLQFAGYANNFKGRQVFPNNSSQGLVINGYGNRVEVDFIQGSRTGVSFSGVNNVLQPYNTAGIRITGSYTGVKANSIKAGNVIKNASVKCSGNYGIDWQGRTTLLNCVSKFNYSNSLYAYGAAEVTLYGGELGPGVSTGKSIQLSSGGGVVSANNTLVNLSELGLYMGPLTDAGTFKYTKLNGVATDNGMLTPHSSVFSSTTLRRGGSGIGWVLQPLTALCNVISPAALPMAKVAVNASSVVTAKLWVQRSNTGLSLNFRVKEGIVTSTGTLEVAAAAAADTWEELTLSFTPGSAGVVELLVEAYGGTTYQAIVDDLSVVQA